MTDNIWKRAGPPLGIYASSSGGGRKLGGRINSGGIKLYNSQRQIDLDGKQNESQPFHSQDQQQCPPICISYINSCVIKTCRNEKEPVRLLNLEAEPGEEGYKRTEFQVLGTFCVGGDCNACSEQRRKLNTEHPSSSNFMEYCSYNCDVGSNCEKWHPPRTLIELNPFSPKSKIIKSMDPLPRNLQVYVPASNWRHDKLSLLRVTSENGESKTRLGLGMNSKPAWQSFIMVAKHTVSCKPGAGFKKWFMQFCLVCNKPHPMMFEPLANESDINITWTCLSKYDCLYRNIKFMTQERKRTEGALMDIDNELENLEHFQCTHFVAALCATIVEVMVKEKKEFADWLELKLIWQAWNVLKHRNLFKYHMRAVEMLFYVLKITKMTMGKFHVLSNIEGRRTYFPILQNWWWADKSQKRSDPGSVPAANDYIDTKKLHFLKYNDNRTIQLQQVVTDFFDNAGWEKPQYFI